MFPQEEVQARIHVMQQEVLQRKVLMEEIKQWQGKKCCSRCSSWRAIIQRRKNHVQKEKNQQGNIRNLGCWVRIYIKYGEHP